MPVSRRRGLLQSVSGSPPKATSVIKRIGLDSGNDRDGLGDGPQPWRTVSDSHSSVVESSQQDVYNQKVKRRKLAGGSSPCNAVRIQLLVSMEVSLEQVDQTAGEWSGLSSDSWGERKEDAS